MPTPPRHARDQRLMRALRHSAPLSIALLVSIPAFYDSLMPAPGAWAQLLYGLSGTLVLATVWRQRRPHRAVHRSETASALWAGWPAAEVGDVLLGAALLAAAVLPASSASVAALGARLLLALATLLRLLVVSKPLFEHAGLARLLAMAAGVLGLCGVGFYLIDPDVETLGDGLWLAFSTAATVGYGDRVPSTTASRIFSVFVVLLGYGVLSLVTASIAAMFVDSQERKLERDILRDMHQQLRSVKDEIAELRLALQKGQAAQATPLSADASAGSRPHEEA